VMSRLATVTPVTAPASLLVGLGKTIASLQNESAWANLFEERYERQKDWIETVIGWHAFCAEELEYGYDQSIGRIRDLFEQSVFHQFECAVPHEFLTLVLLSPGASLEDLKTVAYPSNIQGIYLYNLDNPETRRSLMMEANNVLKAGFHYANENRDMNDAIRVDELPPGLVEIEGPTWNDMMAAIRQAGAIMGNWYQRNGYSVRIAGDFVHLRAPQTSERLTRA